MSYFFAGSQRNNQKQRECTEYTFLDPAFLYKNISTQIKFPLRLTTKSNTKFAGLFPQNLNEISENIQF